MNPTITYLSPEKKKLSHLTFIKSHARAKNNPTNFNLLFYKYFIKEEHKLNLKKYLIELYHDLSHLSLKEENGVSFETFICYLNTPYPISLNIFKLLDKDKNNYLNLEEFAFGLYDIYSAKSFHKLSKFVFDLYDTNRDGLISKEDIQLILSYLPLEKNLRKKFLIKDYNNINYIEISKNQKLIENTLNKIYQSKNFLNYETFIYTIKNINSDIFVAVLIYLYESRPFNNDVLDLYSYTRYDYFKENKNFENFNNIYILYKKHDFNIKNKKKEIELSLEEQIIEEPKIDFRELNLGKFYSRSNQKNFTHKDGYEIIKKNKSNQHLLKINNLKRKSFLFVPKGHMLKKMNSGNLLIKKNLNEENEKLNIYELLTLNDTYESNVFKITNKGKLKSYYMKLIKQDIFYYKNKNDKFHIGMHHLINNIYITKNKRQNFKLISLFSLSIIFQEKKHTFYFDKESQCDEWYNHLKKSIFFRKIDDFFILGEKISSDKNQILRNIRYKDDIISNYYDITKKIICLQINKPRSNLSKKINEYIFNQISCFKICYHKNFPKLIDIFNDEKYIYVIFEKLSDLNVLKYLADLDIHNPFKEEEKICEIIHQILMGVYYLHKMGIVHRNIKPDNILIITQNNSTKSFSESFSSGISNSSETQKLYDLNITIKLMDYRLVKFLNTNEKIKEPYGTVGYLSPEMLSDQLYDKKIDEWSIGIITHLLLCGKLPFSDEYSEKEIARQTIHEKINFEQPKWEKISKEAKDFVNKLLIKDPNKRMDIKNALIHPWIRKYFSKLVEERIECKNNFDNNNYEFDKFSTNNYAIIDNL